MEDFQREPLTYDIKINNYAYTAFIKGETKEVIKGLDELLEKKDLNLDPITLLNGYIVLSSAYQIEGRWDELRQVIEIIAEIIKKSIEFTRYKAVIISALITIASFLYNTEQYEELLKHSKHLIEYQEKHSEYGRMYFVEFYFSLAYYKTNKITESKEHFMRGLYSVLLLKNKIDIGFIIKIKGFKEVSKNLDIDQKLLDELYEILESPGI